MISLYKLLVFVHVLAAVAWLGGGIVLEFLHLRIGKTPTVDNLREFFSIAHWLSPRIFMPTAIVTLLSGITLVFLGGTSFGDAWIVIALIGVAFTVFLGATQIGPTVERINAALQNNESMSVIEPLGRRLSLVARLDLAILLFVLLDMVFKPSF